MSAISVILLPDRGAKCTAIGSTQRYPLPCLLPRRSDMSLDQNLFTLYIAASTVSPPDIDLTDPASSNVLYRKRRATAEPSDTQNAYQWSLHDPLSGAVFCTVSGAHSTSKKKTLTLHDPDVPVEFSFTGSMYVNFTQLIQPPNYYSGPLSGHLRGKGAQTFHA
jgi:hypothetical protein